MQLDAGIFAKSNKNACSEQIYNVSDKSFYFCARNFSMLILVSLLTGICKKRLICSKYCKFVRSRKISADITKTPPEKQ